MIGQLQDTDTSWICFCTLEYYGPILAFFDCPVTKWGFSKWGLQRTLAIVHIWDEQGTPSDPYSSIICNVTIWTPNGHDRASELSQDEKAELVSQVETVYAAAVGYTVSLRTFVHQASNFYPIFDCVQQHGSPTSEVTASY